MRNMKCEMLNVPDFLDSSIEKPIIVVKSGGSRALDHDDGSQFFRDEENVLVGSGVKNFLGNSKQFIGNLIVGAGERGICCYQSDGANGHSNHVFANNTCICKYTPNLHYGMTSRGSLRVVCACRRCKPDRRGGDTVPRSHGHAVRTDSRARAAISSHLALHAEYDQAWVSGLPRLDAELELCSKWEYIPRGGW